MVKSHTRKKKKGGTCVVKAYNKKVRASAKYKKASAVDRKNMLKKRNVGERWKIK